MSAIRKTISIPSELVQEIKHIEADFNVAVESALIEYLRHHRLQKAMGSFGSWEPRTDTSVNCVNSLREERSRYDNNTARH